MKYRNIDNWKTTMKKIAYEKNLDVQDVQQRYVLEEFAEKIGKSIYKELLVFKGGFVVSTLLGLDTRMTRDLDVTCRSTIYNIDELKEIVEEIVNTETESFFEYSLHNLKYAQDDDKYSGFIATIGANRGTTCIKIKIDISNNTLIYPQALDTSLISLFSDSKINLMTYSIENIIAEKFETTLDRGEFNTRMRDLFDIYLLMKENSFMIDNSLLVDAIVNVSKDRNTLDNLNDFDDIIDYLSDSEIFNKNFLKYKDEQYPKLNISLFDIFKEFKKINQMILSSQV